MVVIYLHSFPLKRWATGKRYLPRHIEHVDGILIIMDWIHSQDVPEGDHRWETEMGELIDPLMLFN